MLPQRHAKHTLKWLKNVRALVSHTQDPFYCDRHHVCQIVTDIMLHDVVRARETFR